MLKRGRSSWETHQPSGLSRYKCDRTTPAGSHILFGLPCYIALSLLKSSPAGLSNQMLMMFVESTALVKYEGPVHQVDCQVS